MLPFEKPWTVAMVAVAITYVVLAQAIARNRTVPGARAMAVVLLAISVWLCGATVVYAADTLSVFLAGTRIEYVGVAAVPVAFFVFYVQYAQRYTVSVRLIRLLCVIPAVTVLLVWTNEWHGMMWHHPPVGPDGTPLIRMDWGPWFRDVHTPYSYALMALGFVLLGRELFGGSRLQRSQVVVVLTAAALPFAANVAYLAGVGGSRLSVTPFAFAASGGLVAWGFLRLHLFRVTPIAYHAVFDTMRDGVIVLDHDDRVVDMNPVAEQFTGGEAATAVGRAIREVLPPDSPLRRLVAPGSEVHTEYEVVGEHREVDVRPILDDVGRTRGRVVILRDITQRKRAERALRENEALLRSIVEHAPSGIVRLRPVRDGRGVIHDFRCILANGAAARYMKRRLERLLGASLVEVAPPRLALLRHTFEQVALTGEQRELETSVSADGEERWFRIIAVPVGDDISVTFFDITQRKRREHALRMEALRDPLTELLNRRGFAAEAAARLAALMAADAGCTLLYLDLDDFKVVNDAHGHDAGDAVLRSFADRLRASIRSEDVVARIGGDEFILFLPGVDRLRAQEVAERLRSEVARPHRWEGRALQCTVSVGVAHAPEDGTTLETLVAAADRAMYRTKGDRGSRAS